jgi:hypothetical protein
MPSPLILDEPDWGALSRAFATRLGSVASHHAERAAAVLARLSPEHWAVEWFLPSWLGEAYCLARPTIFEMSMSNLLGLVALRTLDDLSDGEVPAADRPQAGEMADELLEEALRPYRAWFESGSIFWLRFDGWLAEWRSAIAQDRRRPPRLAARGAPLKGAAFAACLLADRTADAPGLERSLDRSLEALVLYDDLADWEDDVAAGRWNAFVAEAVRSSPPPATVVECRSVVLRGLVATDLLDVYLGRITAASRQSERLADRAGLPQLAQYQRGFAARATRHVGVLRAQYADVGRHAAAVIFGGESSLGKEARIPM